MDNVRCIGRAMSQVGLSGDDYFWLTMWADVDKALWNNDTSSVYFQLFQNMVSLVPSIDTDTPLHRQFVSDYRTRPTASDYVSVAGKLPTETADLAYDATLVLAHAWHDALYVRHVNVLADPAAALTSLRASNVTGLSGQIAFDAKQNRKNPIFDFVQLSGTMWLYRGQYFSATESVVLKANDASAFFAALGGVKPPDYDPLCVFVFVTLLCFLLFCCSFFLHLNL